MTIPGQFEYFPENVSPLNNQSFLNEGAMITPFLGGLSVHLNHLIAQHMTNYDWPFGILPFGLFWSNLDTMDLKTCPRTYSGHFWNMLLFNDSRAIWPCPRARSNDPWPRSGANPTWKIGISSLNLDCTEVFSSVSVFGFGKLNQVGHQVIFFSSSLHPDFNLLISIDFKRLGLLYIIPIRKIIVNEDSLIP